MTQQGVPPLWLVFDIGLVFPGPNQSFGLEWLEMLTTSTNKKVREKITFKLSLSLLSLSLSIYWQSKDSLTINIHDLLLSLIE